MFIEPMLFILLMVSFRLFIKAGDTIAGSEKIPWLILGLVAFFMFRDIATRSMDAFRSNAGLFSYRQVKPFDTVWIRAVLEAFLRTVVLLILLLIFGLLGNYVIPVDAFMALIAWISIFLLAFGLGLTLAMLVVLFPVVRKIVEMMMMPMLLLSGVILPLHSFPPGILEYLMYNPVVHGLELFRVAFLKNYWTMDGVSWLYLYYWNIGLLFLGLLLYYRFGHRISAQ
jgi:capsular polysaccharide transport system permease protein